MKKICLSLLALIYFNASSQDYHVSLDYFLPNNLTYNSEIPTPASVIGYELGDWHITHDKLLQYMYRLAESSDRVSIENRGETFEGRPLILLYISSPKNQKNLQEIRKKTRFTD